MSGRTRISLSLLAPLVLPAILLAAAPLSALDVSSGRLRLTLNEGTGRFLLSGQTKGNSGVFVPLLSAQDPRTSSLSIVVGNKIYKMGETSEFSEKAEQVQGGARFVWKSSFLQATETFTFISALDSPVTTGVRIDLNLKNLSDQKVTAGARYLFDTYLGESGGLHFRTSSVAKMATELTVKPADKAAWWSSPLPNDADDFGFQVMLTGDGITAPDRVVFANWKRLSDTSWAYDTSTARNFSLLPYSVNDSAAAQYYEPRSVPPAGESTITLAVGVFSKAGYSGANILPAASAGAASGGDTQAARSDLSALDALLNQIDARMGNPGAISDEELGLIESTLRDLGSRAGRFAPASSR